MKFRPTIESLTIKLGNNKITNNGLVELGIELAKLRFLESLSL